MTMALEIQTANQNEKTTRKKLSVRWDKISEQDKSQYHNRLLELSHLSSYPSLSCGGLESTCHCDSQECQLSLQQEYDAITDAIKIAHSVLPCSNNSKHEKNWWCEELSVLKNQSIEIQRLWISAGRPNNGTIHHERLRVRAAYKRAIRRAQTAPKQDSWNQLHCALESCDSQKFWHSWKSLYRKEKGGFSPIVNGCTSPNAIADSFKQAFQKNSKPNNPSKVEELNQGFASKYKDFSASHRISCDCNNYKISVTNVIEAICGMKTGKCADDDGITAEHLQNAPLPLLHRLIHLFNDMLSHSFVPQ